MYAKRKANDLLLLVTGAAHAGDFELCINGVNLQGRACTGLGGGTGGMRNQQIVAGGFRRDGDYSAFRTYDEWY
ncbi:MAG: hypothetical protein CM1200mP41_27780 [Gammaproteobacteria bacterium]|nr:MAG: hypothetical protein CM1200mP41_27780 [Gammaproteobacteria bacterium]